MVTGPKEEEEEEYQITDNILFTINLLSLLRIRSSTDEIFETLTWNNKIR
jgi:hypothetical protein